LGSIVFHLSSKSKCLSGFFIVETTLLMLYIYEELKCYDVPYYQYISIGRAKFVDWGGSLPSTWLWAAQHVLCC
jgi:hypothetical protein